MIKPFLEIGKIVGTHGLKGEVRVEPWCDTPQFFSQFETLYFDEGKIPIKVSSRPHKNMIIAKLDGVDSIDEAEKLRGKLLWMNRDDVQLNEGVYYIQDLLGCRVIDIDSEREYGIISKVHNAPANDVYEVTDNNNYKYLVPVIPDVVKSVDVVRGIVKIKPMKGIFSDED